MKNPKAQLPYLTDQFIEALDTLYPTIQTTPKDTLSEVMFVAGERSVINSLKLKAKQQRDNHRA